MMLEIDIESDEEWDSSTDWSLLVRRAAESALAESAFPQLVDGPRPVELSVRLTNDDEVRALNAEWRGKDKPTNVLSFPLTEVAELQAAAVDKVFLTGGTSFVPAVRRLFERRFDAARIESGGELLSIAHGLALIGESGDITRWAA